MNIKVNIDSYKHENTKELFFKNISFSIDQNGQYFIIGSSGIGKSTLLNIMLGLEHGDLNGSIIYSIGSNTYSPFSLRKAGLVGYQSQEFCLIPWKSVEQNLLLPSVINKHLREKSRTEIVKHLEYFNLEESVLKEYPDNLSLGMRVRVGLIRSIIYKPKILILDELFTGIDSYTNDLISNRLLEISKNVIIISVSHSIERAITLADELFVLHKNHSYTRELSRYFKKDFSSDTSFIINHLKN